MEKGKENQKGKEKKIRAWEASRCGVWSRRRSSLSQHQKERDREIRTPRRDPIQRQHCSWNGERATLPFWARQNRESLSQWFSFALVKSQGNSTERARFSLGIRRMKSRALAMENRSFESQCSLFKRCAGNRSDFRPTLMEIRNRNLKNKVMSVHSDCIARQTFGLKLLLSAQCEMPWSPSASCRQPARAATHRHRIPRIELSHLKTNSHSWFLTSQRRLRKNDFSCRKCFFLQKNALSCWKMPFLKKNALSCRKMRFSGGHIARNRRKSQEGFRAQESRTPANFHKTVFLKRNSSEGVERKSGGEIRGDLTTAVHFQSKIQRESKTLNV